jgi:hypothetical protein
VVRGPTRAGRAEDGAEGRRDFKASSLFFQKKGSEVDVGMSTRVGRSVSKNVELRWRMRWWREQKAICDLPGTRSLMQHRSLMQSTPPSPLMQTGQVTAISTDTSRLLVLFVVSKLKLERVLSLRSALCVRRVRT